LNRQNIAAALVTAALAVGLTACSTDKTSTTTKSASTSTPAPSAVESPFGEGAVDRELGTKIHRDNATTIVETVEQRGGTPGQALAALLAGEAETGWRSGLSMPAPTGGIRDIYGWYFGYNIAADSTDAVRAATHTFMDNTAAVTVDAGNPVAYALAVQQADPRGYDEEKHFHKSGETAAGEYATALSKAQAAYAELRGAP
jgi:hypothetical protein